MDEAKLHAPVRNCGKFLMQAAGGNGLSQKRAVW
jgi:hypothetical protein